MSENKILERIELLRWIVHFKRKQDFYTFSIIGKPGSGKTTLSLLLGNLISRYFFYTNEAEALDEENILKLKDHVASKRKVVLILDDFSFMITGRSEADRRRLYNLFRIRHILGESHEYYIFLVAHYVRALAPTLRASWVKILTSIDSAEIKMYSSEYMFSESSLLAYYEYYTTYNDKYIILVNKGVERIIDATIPFIDKLVDYKLKENLGSWSYMEFKHRPRVKLLNMLIQKYNNVGDGR